MICEQEYEKHPTSIVLSPFFVLPGTNNGAFIPANEHSYQVQSCLAAKLYASNNHDGGTSGTGYTELDETC